MRTARAVGSGPSGALRFPEVLDKRCGIELVRVGEDVLVDRFGNCLRRVLSELLPERVADGRRELGAPGVVVPGEQLDRLAGLGRCRAVARGRAHARKLWNLRNLAK